MPSLDFSGHSLILYKGNKILFSSDGKGLRPVVESLNHVVDDCMIYDKVVGLASAKIIASSGKIIKVKTDICSKDAYEYLIEKKIITIVKLLVDNILNVDQTDICPMEKRAGIMGDSEFVDFMKNKVRQ